MMLATSPLPCLTTPHGDHPPSAAPLCSKTPTPPPPLTPPRREGHLLLNLSALQPVVITTGCLGDCVALLLRG
jgi:hypothetical protein